MKFFRNIIPFVLVLISLPTLNAQDTAYRSGWVLPAPVTRTIDQVHFIDSLRGFLTTDYHTILRTTDGGYRWEDVRIIGAPISEQTGAQQNWQRGGVKMRDAMVGAVLYGPGSLLRTTDGGETWSYLRPKQFKDVPLVKMSALGDSVLIGFGSFRSVRSTDWGLTWSVQSGIDIPNEVHHAGNRTYVALGVSIYRTTNFGKNWTETESARANGVGSFNDRGEGFYAQLYGAHYTRDFGETWEYSEEYRRGGDNPSLYSLARLNDSVCVIGGGTRVSSSTSGPFGFLARTTNSGGDWELVENLPPSVFYGGTRHPDGRLFFAGSSGVIAQSSDEGRTWSSTTTNPSITFKHILFLTGDHGIAIGRMGGVVHTTDGGETWSEVFPYGYKSLHDIAFFGNGSGTGIAVGADTTILQSTDDGATWSVADGVHWSGSPRNFTDYTRVLAHDAERGFILGKSAGRNMKTLLLKSTDGGASWHERYYSEQHAMHGLAALDDSLMLMVGEKRGNQALQVGCLLRSTDLGETWNEIEEADAPQPLWSVDILDSVHCIAVGAGELVLYSEDGGVTWEQHHENIATDDVYNGVHLRYHDVAYVVYRAWVVRLSDRGKQSTKIYRSDAVLLDLAVRQDSSMIAVGAYGSTIVSDDYGVTWDSASRLTLSDLYGVSRNSAGDWFSVGDGGVIIRTGLRVDSGTGTDTSSSVVQQERRVPSEGLTLRVSGDNGAVSFLGESLPAGEARLSIYSIRGRLVDLPFTGRIQAGSHTWHWYPSELPAGPYLYLLEIHGEAGVRSAGGVIGLDSR